MVTVQLMKVINFNGYIWPIISTSYIYLLTIQSKNQYLKFATFKTISNETLREEKIKNMKNKLDLIIEDENWDCEDIFLEHDYTKSSVFECVVYYLGG